MTTKDKEGAKEKSVVADKEKFSGDKTAHMGDKPAQADGNLSKTGQGQGQSKGKPQVQPQE